MGGERAEEFAEIQNPPERGSWKLCLGCVMRMDNLCAQYQALEGHTGHPDLGLSQKRELIPALKDSPRHPTIW